MEQVLVGLIIILVVLIIGLSIARIQERTTEYDVFEAERKSRPYTEAEVHHHKLEFGSKTTPNTSTRVSEYSETEIRNLVQSGKKILAIKMLIEKTGMSLSEAKRHIDKY
ncbi:MULTISPECIES: hypothetical protein [Erysipelothrix]|uniref:50S ribosomal protein L7/L12 n=1 Tax=Erysipelothrix piscisicarius TaxID=2485784 RepID=A0A3S8RNA6_9FIRM|nr:hypothetical protein [Erysipelothrix piscisicarius]AZK44367.1 50S ribosomal protein L7/L12 [Erysipelothrix piscisicarius]